MTYQRFVMPASLDEGGDEFSKTETPAAAVAVFAANDPESPPSAASAASAAGGTRENENLDPVAFEERAAIIEHDGGVPKAWAEGLAMLDTAKQPRGFKADDWRMLIDNAADFIDRHAARAAALGWSAEEVFGVRPKALGTFWGNAGLLPNLRHSRVVEILADRVVLRTATGGASTFHRRPLEGDVVPVWHAKGNS